MEQCEAEQKFWSIPEAVEALVSFLDPESTLQILQLMELEEPSTFLLPLLDDICDIPWYHPHHGTIFRQVEIICPRHPEPHAVLLPSYAFLLLEEVEGAFGTAEQSIKSISVNRMREPLVSAISSRMSRQQEIVASIEANWIFVENKSGAQALTTLLQAQEISVGSLGVSGPLGKKGWHMLAAAVPEIEPWVILITRQALAGARKYHIAVIWLAIPWVGGIHVYKSLPDEYEDPALGGIFVAKFMGHDCKAAWKRLKQIRDMTEEEFTAAEFKESDSESGEEEIEEEEHARKGGGKEDNWEDKYGGDVEGLFS